jgi:hypothetical protein
MPIFSSLLKPRISIAVCMENKYDAYDMLSLSYTVCPPRKCNKKTTFTDISSNQLFFVINAGHSDLTHAARGEVVGVGGDEGHF